MQKSLFGAIICIERKSPAPAAMALEITTRSAHKPSAQELPSIFTPVKYPRSVSKIAATENLELGVTAWLHKSVNLFEKSGTFLSIGLNSCFSETAYGLSFLVRLYSATQYLVSSGSESLYQ